MCSGGNSADDSDDAFVCPDEGLDVRCSGVVSAPDGDATDQMWIDVSVVLLCESFSG